MYTYHLYVVEGVFYIPMFHHKVQNIKEHFGKHFNNRGGYDIDVNWSQFSLDGHREEKQREILGTYMKSFTTNRRHKRN